MKNSFILIFSILLSSSLVAQSSFVIKDKAGNVLERRVVDISKACNPDQIFMMAAKPATFKGGFNQLELELNQKLNIDKKQKSITQFMFLVNCKGEISQLIYTDREVLESTLQIIQYIASNPKWSSAKNYKDKSIDTYRTFQVTIKKGTIKIN